LKLVADDAKLIAFAKYASTILHVRPRFGWRWLLQMRPASGIGLIVDGVMVLRAEPPLVPTLLHSFSAGLGMPAFSGGRTDSSWDDGGGSPIEGGGDDWS